MAAARSREDGRDQHQREAGRLGHGGREGEAQQQRVVIAGPLGERELRVEVDDVEARDVAQRRIDQDVVEILAGAFEDVGLALRRRQSEGEVEHPRFGQPRERR